MPVPKTGYRGASPNTWQLFTDAMSGGESRVDRELTVDECKFLRQVASSRLNAFIDGLRTRGYLDCNAYHGLKTEL
jgi:hypothetical protein